MLTNNSFFFLFVAPYRLHLCPKFINLFLLIYHNGTFSLIDNNLISHTYTTGFKCLNYFFSPSVYFSFDSTNWMYTITYWQNLLISDSNNSKDSVWGEKLFHKSFKARVLFHCFFNARRKDSNWNRLNKQHLVFIPK